MRAWSPTILQLVAAAAALAGMLASPALWPTFAAAQEDAPAFAQRVMQERNCRNCHVIAGEGAPGPGPDLTTVGQRRTGEWLHRWLRDPAAIKPGTLMPTFDWTQEELDAVVPYLLSLSDQGDPAAAPSPPRPGFPPWWVMGVTGAVAVVAAAVWIAAVARKQPGRGDESR